MCEDNVKYITTLKEIRVINDPYRREILTAMRLLEKPVTAKEIADFLGEPPSKVNYHVSILHKYGFIDLHHTENINGIIAKFFNRSLTVWKIKMEGTNTQSKEKAAMRDIISSTFDTARDRYIAAMSKYMESGNDESDTKTNAEYDEEYIFSRKVYLNDDELNEFTAFVDRIENNPKEGRKMYDLFASYIDIENELP